MSQEIVETSPLLVEREPGMMRYMPLLDDCKFVRIRTFPNMSGVEIQVVELNPILGPVHCSEWIPLHSKADSDVLYPLTLEVGIELLTRKLNHKILKMFEARI